jgi:hypothetical protein
MSLAEVFLPYQAGTVLSTSLFSFTLPVNHAGIEITIYDVPPFH